MTFSSSSRRSLAVSHRARLLAVVALVISVIAVASTLPMASASWLSFMGLNQPFAGTMHSHHPHSHHHAAAAAAPFHFAPFPSLFAPFHSLFPQQQQQHWMENEGARALADHHARLVSALQSQLEQQHAEIESLHRWINHAATGRIEPNQQQTKQQQTQPQIKQQTKQQTPQQLPTQSQQPQQPIKQKPASEPSLSKPAAPVSQPAAAAPAHTLVDVPAVVEELKQIEAPVVQDVPQIEAPSAEKKSDAAVAASSTDSSTASPVSVVTVADPLAAFDDLFAAASELQVAPSPDGRTVDVSLRLPGVSAEYVRAEIRTSGRGASLKDNLVITAERHYEDKSLLRPDEVGRTGRYGLVRRAWKLPGGNLIDLQSARAFYDASTSSLLIRMVTNEAIQKQPEILQQLSQSRAAQPKATAPGVLTIPLQVSGKKPQVEKMVIDFPPEEIVEQSDD